MHKHTHGLFVFYFSDKRFRTIEPSKLQNTHFCDSTEQRVPVQSWCIHSQVRPFAEAGQAPPKLAYHSLKSWLKTLFPFPEQKSPLHAASLLFLSSIPSVFTVRWDSSIKIIIYWNLDWTQPKKWNWNFKVQKWFVGENEACDEGCSKAQPPLKGSFMIWTGKYSFLVHLTCSIPVSPAVSFSLTQSSLEFSAGNPIGLCTAI